MTIIRWGILGCGNIANKFAFSLKPVEDGELVAVASQTPGKASAFAAKHDVAQAYENYAGLLERDDVDAVYVASTHNFHCEHALQALKAGKHVLCEKPLAINAEQAAAMIEASRGLGLFLMEAMWKRFVPTMTKAHQWIQEGKIGEIRQIQASFGFVAGPDPQGRLLNPELAGGALLDVGIYPLSLFTHLLPAKPPLEVKSLVTKGETGVDVDASIHFKYSEGVTAHAYISLITQLRNDALIIGDQGHIYLPAHFGAFLTAELHRDGQVEEFTPDHDHETAFRWEIEEVHRCLEADRIESPAMPLDETLALAKTMDNLRADWGIHYPGED